MSFEARYMQFLHAHNIGVMNEKVWGPFRLKHLIYMFTALMAVWRGVQTHSPQACAVGTAIAVIGLASALLTRGSMSFETKLLAYILTAIEAMLESKAPQKQEKKPSREEVGKKLERIRSIFRKQRS